MLQMPMIGTIHNMVKTQQLQMKWQMRKADPKMEKGTPEERQIANFYEQAEQMRKSNAVLTIDSKLQAGQKITDEELEYLRVNNPDLYKKAVEAAMEREQYKKALENCKTKEDVERLNANKMQNFLAETKVIRGNPNIPQGKKLDLLKQITRRMMGVQNEHAVFTGNPRYADLPREAELAEGKKKKKENRVELPEQELKPDLPYTEQKPEASEPDSGKKPVGEAAEKLPAKPQGTGIGTTATAAKPGAAGRYAAAVADSLPEGTGTGSRANQSAPSAAVKPPATISARA